MSNLYLVITIGNKKYGEELHLWDISNGNFQEMLDDELAEDPDMGVFPDLQEGKTLNIRFSEEHFNKNKYYAASRIDFVDRDDVYDDTMLEDAPNLDEIFTVLTYKELQVKFLELGEEDVEVEPKNKESDPDPDDEPREERVRIKRTRERSSDKDKKEQECPHGHEFGKDFDDFADCDDCEVFEDCGEKNKEDEE